MFQGFLEAAITLLIVAGILFSLFFILFLVSRYRKFSTNVYVIHLRHGKVKYAGRGGKLYKLPIIDEVKVLPASVQSSTLETSTTKNRTGFLVSATMSILWRITTPEIAYNAFSWNPRDENFVETILKKHSGNLVAQALGTTGDGIKESPEETKTQIASSIKNQLTTVMEGHGIAIESVTIDKLTIINDVTVREDVKEPKLLRKGS